MNATVIRNLVYSRLCFFGAIAVCLLISRGALETNSGISYYGVTPGTEPWYSIGLLGAGWFVLRATRAMDRSSRILRRLALALNVLVVLVLGVLLTPYTVASWMYPVHAVVSGVLFILELLVSGWLVVRVQPGRVNQVLAAGQLVCGVAALLSLVNILPLMTPAQLGFELYFAVVLLRSAHGLVPNPTEVV